MRVSEIMTRDVLTVTPDTPIKQIISVLSGQAISGLPVVEADGRLVGIVSEGDLVMREKPVYMPAAVAFLGALIFVEDFKQTFEDLRRHVGATAQDVMTHAVITIGPEATTEEAAKIMIDRDVKRLPVVEGDRLIGILTRKDLVRSLLV
ncbi:MAG: CBS domain-containing protein [Candidatus Sericytochromatia bacterium]